MNSKSEISTLLKKLREQTQAGFMDCKKALEATEYCLEAAVKWLREKGIAKAASKNVDRVATEGTTWAAADHKGFGLLELNSQTDFTGKSPLVLNLAESIINLILKHQTGDLTEVLNLTLADGHTVNDACLSASAKTGEKIALRRVFYHPLSANQSVGVYRHDNGKISSVILCNNVTSSASLKGVAMHITAMNPQFINDQQVDANWLNNEREILMQQLVTEDKPAAFKDKIVQGRLTKLLAEVCLVNQEYILVPKQSVGAYLKSLNVEPVLMLRYELGEGVEKVTTDFVSEVQAQMRK